MVSVFIYYKNQKVIIHPAFKSTKDEIEDLNALEKIFKGVEGFSKTKSF